MKRIPFPKSVAIFLVLLVCGTALGVVIWRATARNDQGNQPSSVDSGSAQSAHKPQQPLTAKDQAIDDSQRRAAVPMGPGADNHDQENFNKQTLSIGLDIRANPSLAASLTKEILSSNDPDMCKSRILALGMAHTEQAKAALLEILVSDADAKVKMLAAAAYAMTANGRIIRLPLREGGVRIAVGAIDDEAALQAIHTDWKYTEDTAAKNVLFELLKMSAANSPTAANSLWEWILEGNAKWDKLKRAADVAPILKANTQVQNMLVGTLLNPANDGDIRFAAAKVLREQSSPTSEENKKALVTAARNDEVDALTRGYAFLGMDASTRNAIELKELNTIIGSKNLPDDIRKSAIKDIRRRAEKIQAGNTE